MKILFVHLGREHLGIEYLSAILKSAGHETVSAVDIGLFGLNDNIFYIPALEKRFSLSDSIVEKFRRERPGLVCMSAYSSTLKWCFETAEKIKKAGDVPIVIGGAASSPALARELGATYVNGNLSAAVTRLRRLARP